MRSVMNISLPSQLLKEVERGVKQGNFATKSEFIRQLLREWKEARLVEELREMREEMRNGEGIILKSPEDLLK